MKASAQRASRDSNSAPSQDATLHKIGSMDFGGDFLIRDLRENPRISLRGVEVDFAADVWDFTMPDSPPTNRNLLRARFSDQAGGETWKLFFLCKCIWCTSKIATLVQLLNRARRAFEGCGGRDARWSEISPENYRRYVSSRLDLSTRALRSELCSLKEYLGFRRDYFQVPIDPELEDLIRRDLEMHRCLFGKVSTPRADDRYLDSLVHTCIRIVDDETEDARTKTYAAALLILTQVGIRMSELLGLEAGKISVSSLPGKEDIAYLEYKVFKGRTADVGYRPHIVVMNDVALKGYRWLEEGCSARREELGIETLIVMPGQRVRYSSRSAFMRGYKLLLLSHYDTIPCIDTHSRFSEFKSVQVSRLIAKWEMDPCRFGLDGTETLVYPSPHTFRVTVATKRYEQGEDLHYLSKTMGHSMEAMTAAYIQSDKELNEANSSLVYRSVFRDGAEFIGPRGGEFQRKVEQFIQELPDHVKADLDEIVAAASKEFPLRRKVGGVCIRCGWMTPSHCINNDETDQIYCAFGVCPNQCVLYFMADECLGRVRSHIELVQINAGRGHTKAARNELKKAQNVMRDALVPELDSLEKQVEAHGRDGVLERFPELEEIVDNLPEVRKEVAGWLEMSV